MRRKTGKGVAEKQEAVPLMFQGKRGWYWRNRHGKYVALDTIPDFGILNLLNRLDERGPHAYYEVFEHEAQCRGLIDAAGRTCKKAQTGPAEREAMGEL
jgi:hypothetical protein